VWSCDLCKSADTSNSTPSSSHLVTLCPTCHTWSHLQVTQCFRGQLQGGKGSTYALVAQGFASCGHDPEPWLVDELISVSSARLPRMDMSDLITLVKVGAS
jgi:hypothetical protein